MPVKLQDGTALRGKFGESPFHSPQVMGKKLGKHGTTAPLSPQRAAAVEVATGPLSVEVRASKKETKLNATERRWLGLMRARGYERIRIQAYTFLLADDTRYTPDFSAIVHNRLVFFEVKGGYIREDAWIKLKTAAAEYAEHDFVLCQWDEGEWTEKEVPK